MSQSGQDDRRHMVPPGSLRPTDHFALNDDNDDVPSTPPYQRDMATSQLTLSLPPDYRPSGPHPPAQVTEVSDKKTSPPQLNLANSNGKLRPILNDNDSEPASPDSPDSYRRLRYEGETLVGKDSQGRRMHAKQNTVHYPDEHGGLMHAMPSPGYPDPRRKREEDTPNMSRAHSRAPSIATTDDESEADEIYDWSDEDDLLDEEAKVEAKLGQGPAKKKPWGIRRIATFFVSTLVGTTILTGLLVTVPILLHFLYLVPERNAHRQYITDNVSAWFFWVAANLMISWYLAVIVNIIPHVITWFMNIAWGTITESFRTNITLFEAFKGWIKPVFYAASAWVSWVIIFANIYSLHDTQKDVTSSSPYTDRLYQVVEFFFFFTLIVCIQKILLQTAAFTFHRTAYEDRVDKVNKALKVLDHLKDYRPKRKTPNPSRVSTPGLSGRMTPPFGRAAANFKSRSRPVSPIDPDILEAGFAADTGEDGTHVSESKRNRKRKSWFSSHKSVTQHHETMPMSPTNRPPGTGRGGAGYGGDTSSAGPSRNTSQDFDRVVRHTYPPNVSPDRPRTNFDEAGDGSTASVDGDEIFAQAGRAIKNAVLHDARNIKGKESTDADISFTITSPHQAKKLARNLYFAFRADGKRTHLIPSDFYPAFATTDEAKEAFKIFDKDNNQNITRAEIKTIIMKIYKERRFLSRSLRDVGAALATLDAIMLLFALIIIFFISLSVFDVNVGKSLTSVYTLGIAASFIFKSAASNAFDAIIFIFVTHPYDTGDRCFIDTENLVVKKMGLLTTTFTRADGTQTYYFNSQLFTKFITNARRSQNMVENLTMQVDWRTPLSKLDALEKAINHWIDTDENRWFTAPTNIMLQRIDYQRSLVLTIGITHATTWQDWGATLNRRTAFHAAVAHYSTELGIGWSNSTQPILMHDQDTYIAPETEPLPADLAFGEVIDDKLPIGSPVAPAAPSSPAMFFNPPRDDQLTGLRNRRSRKRAAHGTMGT